MSGKIISRQKLDALIELVRELRELPYGEEIVSQHITKIIDASKAVEEGSDLRWCTAYDYVWAVLRGLDEDATNEDMYKGMAVFGWTVQDDE